MAKNTVTGSRAITGMWKDIHAMQMGEGFYDHALNARIESFDGNGLPIIQNEGSNLLCANFPEDYNVVGLINIVEQERIIWFLSNEEDGESEIGESRHMSDCRDSAMNGIMKGMCDDCGSVKLSESMPLEKLTQTPCCTYIPLANDECLNFSRKFPIYGVEYRIVEGGIEVFFTDANKSRRRIRFEYENGNPGDNLIIAQEFYQIVGFENPPCETPIYGTDLDCNRLSLQPTISTPCIEFEDLVSGGNNKAGVYQFFIAWADIGGNRLSHYMSATNIIPIRTKDVTFDTDYMTDRAIALKIKNIDFTAPYQYYTLAVAKTINGTTDFREVGTFPITQTSYTYTGNNEAEVKLTIGDLFQRFPFYKTAGDVTSSNDRLFWTNLTGYPSMNLQRVANNIKLQWQTIAIPEAVYRDPRNVNKFRGYMRDEVYPFGIQFILDNTEETSILHIPGREATEADREIVDNPDVIRENNCDDCTNEVEPEPPAEQLLIEVLNTTSCSGGSSGIVLVIDNSFQSSGCPLTPHVDSGCTPATLLGTPPSVNAGVDQLINYLATVPLNGTVVAGSTGVISTIWTQLSGPNTVSINNPGLLNTYFENYNAGVYVFQLCATDVNGNVVVDNVQFTIDIPVNDAPVADPGEDKIVVLPSDSFLNGSASSDADGIASYQWTQLSGPNAATIVSPMSSYTDVTGLIEGVYEFELEVTDSRNCSSVATTKIYVQPDPETVPPNCTELLYPVNGSITTSFNTVVLDWEDVDNALSYDIFLRDNSGLPVFMFVANVADSNYVLTSLTPNTSYDWVIIPKNTAGDATGCDACYRSFVTPVEEVNTNCNKERWEVYNTATIEGGNLDIYDGCEESCYQYGELAYWESTERYPNDPLVWGDLCGEPIRFPKMPDSLVTHIHDNQNGTLDYSRNNLVFPIGIKVDHDSVRDAITAAIADDIITAEEASRIVGYRIFRGNRFQNKSVIAKGLLYDVNQYRRKDDGEFFDNQNIFFANYPFNDLRSNPFVTDDFRNYEDHNRERGADLPFIGSKRYTFHSPDTHFANPTIGTKLKLETVEYGLAEGYFTKSKNQAKQRFLSNTAYSLAFTGGIVAALMRTEEKEVKEYTVKGSIISGMGIASGIFGPFLPYQTGTGAAIIPESTLDTIVNAQRAASINAATEVTTRTIQGKYKDWINPVYLAVKKPALLPFYPLMLANYLAGFLTTVIEEANIIIKLIESLTPYRDWTVQHHAIGKYNAYQPIVNNGDKIRSIESSAYVKSENAIINEPSTTINQFVGIKFNNWNRESSVYLKYSGEELPDAGTSSGFVDMSRYTMEDGDVDCKLDKRTTKPISSYYASIKNYVPDQYGNIFNVQYLSTDSCMFDIDTSNDDCRTVFGGDTFIDRFALKRKVPYFLADTFGLPSGTDFNFADYPNLGVPRHYYNSTLGLGSEFDDIGDIFSLLTPAGIATFLGRPKSIRDCSTNKFFYQNGYIYLYHYGIPYFLVESDVNVSYRHAENLREKAFYPVQSDLDFWLQEENVPIREDNTYFYNNAYSKQVSEVPFKVNGPDFIPGEEEDFSNRIIYASDGNWMVYKVNDKIDFPLSKGKITSIEGIENDTVLVRTINSVSVFPSVLRQQVDGQTVQVGNGGIFSNPPQEFAETTLGYIGSQHKAILHTEFGHVTFDAKRGQGFVISAGGKSLQDITKDGMKNWFKENLPFQVLRDFPNMDEDEVDNAFYGLGLTMSFDKRNSRIFLTKLDYKLKNKNVVYNEETKEFMLADTVVRLGDKRYFIDKSWTVSYSFITKSWVSFYSFKPNYYVDFVDFFGSGQEDGLWLHNITNNSYQVFYGKLYPYIFEPVLKFEARSKALNSITFDTEVRRYDGEYDYVVKKGIPGVNKAVVYNDIYSSGLLNLEKSNKGDLDNIGMYPKRNMSSWDIEVTLDQYKWNFNQFFNLVRDNSELPLWKYEGNNAEKTLNNQAFNYKKNDFDLAMLQGQWFKVMLINDKLSNYKIMSKFILANQTTKIR